MTSQEVITAREDFVKRTLKRTPHSAVVNVTHSSYWCGEGTFISAITIIRKGNKVRFFLGSVYAENVVGTLNLTEKYVERETQFECAFSELDERVDDFFGM